MGREGRRGHAESRGRALAIGLASLAIVAPQILGGALPATQLMILCLASAASLWAAATFQRRQVPLGTVPLAAIGAAVAAAWTLIQALPLPCALLNWAQPERAQLSRELVALGALGSQVCTLSFAPGATWVSFAMATTLCSLLLSSTAVSRAGHTRVLIMGVAASSALMALVALGHTVLGAETVFGAYAPVRARPGLLLAPLLNANHLAGLFVLGFPACLCLAATEARNDVRIAWGTAAFVICGACFFTLSRGGSGALIAGGFLYGAFHIAGGRRRSRSPRNLFALVPIAAGLAVAASFGIGLVASKVETHGAGTYKFEIPLALSGLIKAYPFAGVGRGALGDASGWLIERNARVLYTENLPTQWWIEWGLVVGSLLLGALLVSLLRTRPRRRLEFAMLCGLLALAGQNLVDFNLELAGVACTAAVALGACLGREQPGGRVPLPALKNVLVPAAIAAVAAVAIASPWMLWRSRDVLLQELALTAGQKDGRFAEQLAKALSAYPLDPAFVVAGSGESVRRFSKLAPRWLNLAMQVAPGWSAPHQQAAFLFESLGRLDQAALELSLAADRDAGASLPLACSFLGRHPSAELAWQVAPESAPLRRKALEDLVQCLYKDKRPTEESVALLERVLEAFPDSVRARRALLEISLRKGEANAALAHVEALRAHLVPTEAAAVRMEALVRLGRPEEAMAIGRELPQLEQLDRKVLAATARAAAALKDEGVLVLTLDELLGRHGRRTADRVSLHRLAVELLVKAGSVVKAVAHAQAIYDLSGGVTALEELHRVALKAGILPTALRTASELCQVRHRGNTYCAKAGP